MLNLLTNHVVPTLVSANKQLHLDPLWIHQDRDEEGQLFVPVVILAKFSRSQLEEDVVSARILVKDHEVLSLDSQRACKQEYYSV